MSMEGVDPALVPQRTLRSGAKMPAVGLGTFGSDRFNPHEIAAAVEAAAEIGYRHFDCAAVYGNEAEIGEALQRLMAKGVKREELWITSKLWNDCHHEEEVIPACRASLERLGLDYLDLYLVHWPFPNHHPPGCDVSKRNPNAKPYIHEEFMKTWGRMERLQEKGLARHIGTSNMTAPKLRLLLRDAALPPVANQMELHPHFQQPELFDFLRENAIEPIGYCPIGSPNRPERDRTPTDTSPTTDPVICDIAERLGVHPAVVCVKWAVQRGQTPIPFSVKREQCLASLQAVTGPPLREEDMAAIAAIDRGCRLIKGQVFLWKDGQSWEDLWDPDGAIAP